MDLAPGYVLTYDELGHLFNLTDRPAIQSAVNGAKASVERETKQVLVAVKNEGYKIVSAGEHFGQALHHQRKGRGQTRRALSKAKNTRIEELTRDERDRRDVVVQILNRQIEFEKRADLRYARRDELLKLSEKQERSDSAMQDMADRIARLEKKLNNKPD